MSHPAGNQRNYLSVAALFASLVTPALCPAQTTQGLIAGRVFDVGTQQPVANAVVEYFRREQETVVESGSTHANGTGLYAFSFLPPGTYHIRVCIASCDASNRSPEGFYQSQEIYGLELFVAARLEVNFALRTLTDVWKAGIAQGLYRDSTTAIVHYYASDVAQLRSAYLQLVPYRSASLGASLSYVVDPKSVTNLPLNGRDIYTTLVLQPGVTAGTGTARGLGLSVNGQRPTSSSYLLDGIENNNTLVTGPLTSLAPEMIQEYRLSTSSWSAEYGGAAGFLANAVTRAGGARWHGVGYFNLKNDALSANSFQDNAHTVLRLPFKEAQTGFQAGGPVWKQKLFFSAGLEKYRSRGYKEPQMFSVPSPLLVTRFSKADPAYTLLTDFPTPAISPGDGTLSTISVRPSVTLDRYVGLARADYVSGARRVMLRTTVNRFDWPDFLWYPYKDFTSGLTEPLEAVALGITDAVRPNLTHELHAGWSRSTIRWDRAHPEIPTIAIGATDPKQPPITMPGSLIFYGLHYTNRNIELNDTWAWVRGSHIVKTGGGLLLRGINVLENTGKDGEVIFNSIVDFLRDQPAGYTAALNRVPLEFHLPPPGADNRTYRNRQYFLFGEDTWRLDRRLTLNAGLRWENFGSPVNTGPFKDDIVRLGAGANFAERLATAALIVPPAGDQKLYAADRHNFAPRFGFSWDPGGRAPVIHGGYGIFYDRPFDNILGDVSGNNIVVPPMIRCNPKRGGANLCPNYLAPVNTVLAQLQGSKIAQTFPSLRLLDPHLRSGYAQSYFLGLGKRAADSWEFELNALGALGRRLLTTDVVNRPLDGSAGAFNPALPEILWRSNQGASNYNALAAVARYRSNRGSLQLSYTWSHSIDNQSDPLVGDYWDLSFINITKAAPNPAQAAFTQQFNSRADRATSNFDQRHNLVFYSWWDVPSFGHGRVLDAITRGWHASQMAAFRTGFPYTVRADPTGALINQRADIVDPSQMFAVAGLRADAGSAPILNPAAFAAPASGVIGNSGRNAFRGPGLWNVDLSVSRSFALPFLGESGRLILRSDFYNAFNHANLNNPNSMYGSTDFGEAAYGRLDYNSGSPAVAPLNETPRQIQLIVKLEF